MTFGDDSDDDAPPTQVKRAAKVSAPKDDNAPTRSQKRTVAAALREEAGEDVSKPAATQPAAPTPSRQPYQPQQQQASPAHGRQPYQHASPGNRHERVQAAAVAAPKPARAGGADECKHCGSGTHLSRKCPTK
jgi:hypothetical protein